jgi:hypothetical protein
MGKNNNKVNLKKIFKENVNINVLFDNFDVNFLNENPTSECLVNYSFL